MRLSYFKHPIRITITKILSEFFKTQRYRNIVDHNPKRAIDLQWLCNYGKQFPWDNPRTLNEKIQWLQVYSDTSLWSKYSDKYEVRKFIQEKGYNDILVKCYGIWESVEDIDFDNLPDKFVIKCTHDTGSTYIVDKNSTNIKELKSIIGKHLKTPFGYLSCEPHYLKIKPRIIAEELLENIEDGDFVSSSLVDYKIWCFDGKAFGTWACYNRHRFVAETEWHDLDWNYRPEWSVFTDHYKDGHGRVPKPKNYDAMISFAEDLSKGFPQVRVDLYNIDGQIYFGELTFTSAGGHMNFYSDKVLLEMGKLTKIPTDK